VGTLAPSDAAVRSRTVEGALHAEGQTFSLLGYQDPRLQASGKLDFRLHCQLKGYAKDDTPPSRVKPIPLQLLLHLIQHCYCTPKPTANARGHMLTLGFFFLLRPGEYAATYNPTATPFRVCDGNVLRNQLRLDAMTCPEEDFHSVTHITLESTTQKNGVRGELVGLRKLGHPILCPVHAASALMPHAPSSSPT